ncbi:MAG: hypothetical protein KIS67_28295 [Verrucomicrobiae bacterium]|nr:hypothetical protein [Verrucomicrobiae bacterium]
MKRIIVYSAFVVVGIALGWYFGYTRPVGTNQRKLLEQYQTVRDKFQMTDEEMADYGKHYQDYSEATKREDELAAHIALGVLIRLERGDTEKAKRILEATIGTYYRRYGHTGHTNVIASIERHVATNASLSNAIYGELK